eukprot:Lithocolla_globosa_v1_NODE_2830_length_1855_cov_6.504444.p1 type:complete len:266 gc:universal NODE_2830_length_1855_cov_6.504444:131-928(+)
MFNDYRNINTEEYSKDFSIYSQELKKNILKLPSNLKYKSFKFHVEVYVHFNKPTDLENEGVDNYINSKTQTVFNIMNFSSLLNNAFDQIDDRIDKFTKKGSGFVYEYTNHVKVFFNKYTPMRGASYFKLPPAIADKEACVNIQNEDEKCFEYIGLMENYPKNHHEQMYHYVKKRTGERINPINIPLNQEYPIKLTDIQKYEKLNNCSIYVYEKIAPLAVDCKIAPLLPSKFNQVDHPDRKIVDLLLVHDELTNNKHYVSLRTSPV